MLGGLAAAAAISAAAPSEAAYGDAARVFAGNITNSSGARSTPAAPAAPGACGVWCSQTARALRAGFIPYAGDGFAVLIPSKWNPSKEQDFPGVVLRCVASPGRVAVACSRACQAGTRLRAKAGEQCGPRSPAPTSVYSTRVTCLLLLCQVRGQRRCREQPGGAGAEGGQEQH